MGVGHAGGGEGGVVLKFLLKNLIMDHLKNLFYFIFSEISEIYVCFFFCLKGD